MYNILLDTNKEIEVLIPKHEAMETLDKTDLKIDVSCSGKICFIRIIRDEEWYKGCQVCKHLKHFILHEGGL